MYNAEIIYRLYEEVYRENVEGFRKLLESEGGMELTKAELWDAVKEFYEDPDSYISRNPGGIRCTADGLLSWKRIYAHEGWNPDFVTTYENYRRTPLLFFPCEFGGINMERYQVFRDRIDHAFLDLKNYYAGMENPLMYKAYRLPMTKAWLNWLGSFENLVDWMGVRGILTTENYEVYDLEAGNGEILEDYWVPEKYISEWTENYYNSIKRIYDKMEPEILTILTTREPARDWCCLGENYKLTEGAE